MKVLFPVGVAPYEFERVIEEQSNTTEEDHSGDGHEPYGMATVKEAELPKEVAVVGRAKKGEAFRVSGYENEGGWIPCQGDWYKVNPMAAFVDGELKGRRIGVSFLCAEDTEKLSFRTGRIFFARPNDKLIKKKA